MADETITALRSGNLSAVRTAIHADPKGARHPRVIVEAAQRAFQPAVALLHRNGADLNASYRNYRPLHSLLQQDPHAEGGQPSRERLACLDWLLANGADPEQLGAWPSSRAIIIAAFVGVPEYVERLRKVGAKGDGFAGAALGDRALVKKTLRERPEFARERDSGMLTALQCVAGSRMAGNAAVEIATMLLDAGADVAARTKSWAHEVNAAYFAARKGNDEMFRLLLERGADATDAVSHAVWGGHYGLAEIALAQGAELDRATANGKPLLNDLIRWGQIPQTKWMLEHGASPDIRDEMGWTAAHQAASRGNARRMKAVLDAGADLTRRDRGGYCPIDVAREAKRAKLVEMMTS